MNGAQDLGGMMGFGPVAAETNEPVFHAEWEKRVLAATVGIGPLGLWSIDASRFARESLPPADYLAKSYYEIWLVALEKQLVAHGLLTAEELATGRAMTPPRALARKALTADRVAPMLAAGAPYDRPASAPAAFRVGEKVRAREMNPKTHTRLPRYARGKFGVVEAVRGVYVFPDAAAQGRDEAGQWLYAVRFTASELWGADADAASSVTIDAFEPYLERA
jgi:nitrile hydratase subunit beta